MKRILPLIVIAQFFCTSVWFGANVAIAGLPGSVVSDTSLLAHLTSAVQIGFICGTLLFAVLAIADRFSSSYVFFVCAMLAALFNLLLVFLPLNIVNVMAIRFLTGFCLAGIYPVGMKIIADHFKDSLGKSLGYLVGALALGTAFPHLVKGSFIHVSWFYVVYFTSALACCGGLLVVLFVPDGAHRKKGFAIKFTDFAKGFRHANFRAAALGYFGHMWELYAFWTFLPLMIHYYLTQHSEVEFSTSLFSFIVIAVGAPACVMAGILAGKWGPKKIAGAALTISFLCCLLSPFFFNYSSFSFFFFFMLLWGASVVADSPIFSSQVAKYAPAENRGSSLTIVNCIGFFITIISIEFINSLSLQIPSYLIYTLLAIGPLLGLRAFRNLNESVDV
jgi:MFS family permease